MSGKTDQTTAWLRHQEIVRLWREGRFGTDIARKLGITPSTVGYHANGNCRCETNYLEGGVREAAVYSGGDSV